MRDDKLIEAMTDIIEDATGADRQAAEYAARAALAALTAGRYVGDGWVKCSERLPEIPADVPAYEQRVRVLVCTAGGSVREAAWARNAYAKTDKGRLPRWEDPSGRLWVLGKITDWRPLPAAPQPEDTL